MVYLFPMVYLRVTESKKPDLTRTRCSHPESLFFTSPLHPVTIIARIHSGECLKRCCWQEFTDFSALIETLQVNCNWTFRLIAFCTFLIIAFTNNDISALYLYITHVSLKNLVQNFCIKDYPLVSIRKQRTTDRSSKFFW